MALKLDEPTPQPIKSSLPRFPDGTAGAVGALTAYDGAQKRVGKMGEWGNDDAMKHRESKPLQPAADKPEGKEPMGRTATPRKTEARLGREVQARIGLQLRAMYNDVVSQGVPPHLLDLVRRLSDQNGE